MINIPRISRKELNTPFLHLMVQGINKEYIFKNKKYVETYLELINKYSKEYQITVVAYCVMNNHVHLFIDIEKPSQEEIRERMDIAIHDFLNENNIKLEELFLNKKTLGKIIKTLKNIYKFKYTDIMKRFGITKTKLQELK